MKHISNFVCCDCRCNISHRGNRAKRCEFCQERYRIRYMKQLGSRRRTSQLYQWSKEVEKINIDELASMVTIYRHRIDERKSQGKSYLKLRDKINILEKLYKEKTDNGRKLPLDDTQPTEEDIEREKLLVCEDE